MGIKSRAGVLVVLFAVLGATAAAQVFPKFHHRQGGQVNGLFFLDSARGFTAEEGGRIRYTIDGGVNWEYAEFDNETEEMRVKLFGIFMMDVGGDILGWACGAEGVVLVTVPNTQGQIWKDGNPTNRVMDARDAPLPCGQNKAELFSIFMIDTQAGYVVGNDGTLRKTTNGGTTWFNPVDPAEDFFWCAADPRDIYDIHFFADSSPGLAYSKGIMASEYGNVYLTNDSGSTWTPVKVTEDAPGPTCPPLQVQPSGGHRNLELWSLDFEEPLLSTSPGWVVGGVGTNNGYLYRTSAGGEPGTWEQTKCYEFLNASVGLPVCGIGTSYAVACLDPSNRSAVAGTYGGGVLTFEAGTANFDPCLCTVGSVQPCSPDGKVWVQRDTSTPQSVNPCANRPAVLAAARLSSTEASLGGDFGRIMRYSGGAITDQATTNFVRLGDGEFISDTTGCVVSQGYTILRTTNGGFTWTNVHNAPCMNGESGTGIDFSSSGQYGVAVGTAGFIARSSDFGQSWTDDPVGSNDMTAVSFVPGVPAAGQATVWAVDTAGQVGKSVDNGDTWFWTTDEPGHFNKPGPKSPEPVEPLYGVAFATSTTGYVVGANASVYRTIDAGMSWMRVGVGGHSDETFRDVETWGDGTSALLVADNGGVYEQISHRFTKQDLGSLIVTEHLQDVEVLDDGNTVRICGDNGTVLFRDMGVWSRPRSETSSQLLKMAFQSADHGFGIGRSFLITEYTQ